jgi:hypothetical protein
MMLADYYLTVLGALQAARKYRQHYKTEHYELNPIWQQDIARAKWFNPRHLALVVLISGALLLGIELADPLDFFIQGVLGCTLTMQGFVVGRHLSNLLMFRYLIRKPDEISGEITLSHPLLIVVSAYQHLGALLPLVFIAVFTASWFAYGGVLGMVVLVAVHYVWLRRARRRKAAAGLQPRPVA